MTLLISRSPNATGGEERQVRHSRASIASSPFGTYPKRTLTTTFFSRSIFLKGPRTGGLVGRLNLTEIRGSCPDVTVLFRPPSCTWAWRHPATLSWIFIGGLELK